MHQETRTHTKTGRELEELAVIERLLISNALNSRFQAQNILVSNARSTNQMIATRITSTEPPRKTKRR